jgi:hypothetical protein
LTVALKYSQARWVEAGLKAMELSTDEGS